MSKISFETTLNLIRNNGTHPKNIIGPMINELLKNDEPTDETINSLWKSFGILTLSLYEKKDIQKDPTLQYWYDCVSRVNAILLNQLSEEKHSTANKFLLLEYLLSRLLTLEDWKDWKKTYILKSLLRHSSKENVFITSLPQFQEILTLRLIGPENAKNILEKHSFEENNIAKNPHLYSNTLATAFLEYFNKSFYEKVNPEILKKWIPVLEYLYKKTNHESYISMIDLITFYQEKVSKKH